MGEETYRLDRERLLADRRAAAERVQLEIEGVVAAAASERRRFFEWVVNRLRIEAGNEIERERLWVDMRLASQARTAVGRTLA